MIGRVCGECVGAAVVICARLRVRIGEWCLAEEDSAMGRSRTADVLLTIGGLLGLALGGFGVHVC